MCETQNDQSAQSCKYCGYIFEDFNTTGADALNTSSSMTTQDHIEPEINTSPPPVETNSIPAAPITPSIFSSGSAIFTVTRSLFGSIVPAIIYFLLIASLGLLTLSLSAIFYIVFFVLIAFLPVLFTPRKYQFYETSLTIHKIIGRDTELPYSSVSLYEPVRGGRKSQVILAPEGHKRAMIIPGNPTNDALGLDLKQFLEKRLKRYDPKPPSDRASQELASGADNADSSAPETQPS